MKRARCDAITCSIGKRARCGAITCSIGKRARCGAFTCSIGKRLNLFYGGVCADGDSTLFAGGNKGIYYIYCAHAAGKDPVATLLYKREAALLEELHNFGIAAVVESAPEEICLGVDMP